MPVTKSFRDIISNRAELDIEFRRGMLRRGIALIVAGNSEDFQTGKAFIRDYINATIGFVTLAKKTCISKKA